MTPMDPNKEGVFAPFREALGVRHVLVSLWIEHAGNEKRCEDAPHSKSTSCKIFPPFVSIRVVRGQKNLLGAA